MSSLREELTKLVKTISSDDNAKFFPNGYVDAILAAIQTAVLAAAPEKPSNELIQMSLQNGRQQQAASYNGYAAALNDYTEALKQLFESEQL